MPRTTQTVPPGATAALHALLPHRAPFLLLDGVEGENGGQAFVTLREGNPFVREDGTLEPVAFAEIMAQCFAAVQGSAETTGPRPGFLAALRDVRVLGQARLGDRLVARASVCATLGDIHVVEGEVWRGHELLARGQAKIFVGEMP